MSRAIRSTALAWVLALAVVAVGCGGGDQHLTRKQFITRANDICTSLGRQSQPLRTRPTRTLADLASVSNALAALLSNGLSKLGALDEPPEAEADFTRLIASGRRLSRGFRQLAAAAGRGDAAAVKRAELGLGKLNEAVGGIATRLHLSECAKT